VKVDKVRPANLTVLRQVWCSVCVRNFWIWRIGRTRISDTFCSIKDTHAFFDSSHCGIYMLTKFIYHRAWMRLIDLPKFGSMGTTMRRTDDLELISPDQKLSSCYFNVLRPISQITNSVWNLVRSVMMNELPRECFMTRRNYACPLVQSVFVKLSLGRVWSSWYKLY